MTRLRVIGITVIAAVAAVEYLANTRSAYDVFGAVLTFIAAWYWPKHLPASLIFACSGLVVATLDSTAAVAGLLGLIVTVAIIAATSEVPFLLGAVALSLVTFLGVVALDNNVTFADGLQPAVLLCSVAAVARFAKQTTQRRVEMEQLRAALQLASARADLARDVHDVTSHALMAVLTQLRVGRRGFASNDQRMAERGFDCAEAAARAAIVELRALTLVVAGPDRPNRSDELVRQLSASQTFAEVYQQIDQACSSFPQTTFEHDEARGLVNSKVATTAIRIVQQCLANSAQHARDAPLSVTAKVDTNWLYLTAQNAVLPGGEPGLHLGLDIMGKRVEEIEGFLDIESDETTFSVACRLPIRASS